MGNDTNEVQIARLDERLKMIFDELKAAKDSRKEQYEKMEEFGKSLISIDGRVESVEKSLAGQAPTIEEFITIKHKVVGAGIAGRWLWVGGGALIGVVASSREAIFNWLSK